MAFRNYFPHRVSCPSFEVKEKTLKTVVDNGQEVVHVVQTPIPNDLPDYRTTSIDALQSAGVVPEKVSPYIFDPTISVTESKKSE